MYLVHQVISHLLHSRRITEYQNIANHSVTARNIIILLNDDVHSFETETMKFVGYVLSDLVHRTVRRILLHRHRRSFPVKSCPYS